jgi:hypothetical protein
MLGLFLCVYVGGRCQSFERQRKSYKPRFKEKTFVEVFFQKGESRKGW